MRRFGRFVTIATCVTFALLLALPLALYWLGLSGVEGRPHKPEQLAPPAQQDAVWTQLRGSGMPHVSRDDPYSYVGSLLFSQLEHTSSSHRVCWWVARDYLATHRRHKGMGWWHLSGAALTIWLSRNWTSEEILSRAAQLQESNSRRNRNTSTTKD
jgi:hypothetical protein